MSKHIVKETREEPSVDLLTRDSEPSGIPVTEERVPLSQEEVGRILDTNMALRRIVAILMNGKRAQYTPQMFPMHENLMQRMVLAHRQGNEDDFLGALRLYLERIPVFTPQTGRVSEADALLEEVKDLMMKEGVAFRAVAGKLLSVLNAPV